MSQAIICPTITAFEPHGYRSQMESIEPFAKRVHIDLMDGLFAPHVSPGLDQVWWPEAIAADIHLMYEHPMEQLEQLIELKPSLVVIHYEADVDHAEFAKRLKDHGVKAGLALLQDTSVDDTASVMQSFDHVLVFSGNLGEHGGTADLQLLTKVQQIKEHYPDMEISWDGGINEQNAKELVAAGVNVLNVGGFIQGAADPATAYKKLLSL
jgi:ribulose-phosphate 3-epimerase